MVERRSGDRSSFLGPASHATTWLLALAAVGIAFRLVIVRSSLGSNDILTWEGFARTIRSDGLTATYWSHALFNHPPLPGYLASWSLTLAEALGVRFGIVFKLFQVLADAIAAFLLWRRWRSTSPRAAAVATALFSWNPVSLLISSHHGNTDCLCAMLCLLAADLIERRRALGAGLALGAAINVKLIPVLLIPALALAVRERRDLVRFTAGLAIAAVPFLPVLLAAGPAFQRNALAYRSNVDNWGVNLFVLQSQGTRLAVVAKRFASFYNPTGRTFILAAMLAIAVAGRLRPVWLAYDLGAICFSAFLVLTPGFGIQYIVYPVPLLFAANVRWATKYALLAGLFGLVAYVTFWTGDWPARSRFIPHYPMPIGLFGLLAWVALVRYLVEEVARLGRPAGHALAGGLSPRVRAGP